MLSVYDVLQVHTLPIWVMYVMVAAIIVEYWRPHSFAPQLVRIWCINVLGTWFYHIAFIMYIPLPLPGKYMCTLLLLPSPPQFYKCTP